MEMNFNTIKQEIIDKYSLFGSYDLDEKGFCWSDEGGAEEDYELDAKIFGIDTNKSEMVFGDNFRLREWELKLFVKLDQEFYERTGIKSSLWEMI